MNRILGAVCAALLALAVPAGAASARPGDGGYAPTMLVLDASGSMLAADPGGGTKIDAAKRAVRQFVEAAPETAEVGLSVYGTGTGSSEAEREAGCRDVTTPHPVGRLDRAGLNRAVDGVVPRGYTPIGTALRHAADGLPSDGPRSIVLVSDGIDTCAPPDPCDVARDLRTDGASIIVHAIGFDVDDAARDQLICLAHATGGSYTDAGTGAALEQILPRVTETALRTYEPVGVPTRGTPDVRDAPALGTGQYLANLIRGERQFWTVDVPEGGIAYLTGTAAFGQRDEREPGANALLVRIHGVDGTECRTERNTDVASTGRVVTAALVYRVGADDPDVCQGGGRYAVSVDWESGGSGAARVPLELLVRVEAPATDAGPPARAEPVGHVEQSGPARPVVGGGSFTVAAELDGSGVYTDAVRPGEYVFYRVDLGWGQGLSYRVEFGACTRPGDRFHTNIGTELYSPLRAQIDSATTGHDGSQARALPGDGKALATVPVTYLNREHQRPSVRVQALPGPHYLMVRVNSDAGDCGALPVRIDLAVTDTGGAPPTYESGHAGTDSDTAGPTARPRPSATDNTGRFPEIVLLGAGAGLVVVLAVAAGFALRRRKR
ncbi:VWA domain-containing protein [Nocardia puris]|uniref:vWA domain-containing protein n=1 Tax=Nocardia puris TaxID=208602 RepID=UPI0018945D40|nr:VWA domain-containing protein [Nocardia puris]MBF6212813.1 VWA domain-containing protein [Nocardia puris]MBF6367748.1 VWA domain-containing protein [Nocardia puris]MBF6461399.1 VWA domain-containing protein [Nocardia puris]